MNIDCKVCSESLVECEHVKDLNIRCPHCNTRFTYTEEKGIMINDEEVKILN